MSQWQTRQIADAYKGNPTNNHPKGWEPYAHSHGITLLRRKRRWWQRIKENP